MQFQVGEKVVHPVHGVGTIKSLSKQSLTGDKTQEYYQVTTGSVMLWIPINDQGSTVLRKIAPKASLNQCRELLKRQPKPLDRDHKKRRLEITHRLNDRLLPALCETVRDLKAHSQQMPLGRTESELLQKTFKSLCAEWAAAEGVSAETASSEIEALLQKGR